MQLLDSQKHQTEIALDRLHQELQDIVSKVKIQSSFCISHPDYKPLELPSEAIARFGQLPAELKNKYLSVCMVSITTARSKLPSRLTLIPKIWH